ncbi:MAG: DUF177 domain-containing protein [Herminiimonas sp.]|nr:DUF177 domain-containing protein [Herminiimonas sp.]
MIAIAIDAFDFGRLKERRDGDLPVSQLPRLMKECVDGEGSLRWALRGGTHESGYPELNLQVSGAVNLICQRCLKPFSFEVASESILVLAHDEAQADQIEAMLEDDDMDVIVGSKALDMVALIEDEALLAIPQAPKHTQCPAALVVAEEAVASNPSPFAMLKNLKH